MSIYIMETGLGLDRVMTTLQGSGIVGFIITELIYGAVASSAVD